MWNHPGVDGAGSPPDRLSPAGQLSRLKARLFIKGLYFIFTEKMHINGRSELVEWRSAWLKAAVESFLKQPVQEPWE